MAKVRPEAGRLADSVRRVASWDGWCSPCGLERPLVLCERGPRGLRAWVRGVGPEDRTLVLSCVVCGAGQLVPRDEADDPEVVLTAEPEAPAEAGVEDDRAEPAPAERLAPRAATAALPAAGLLAHLAAPETSAFTAYDAPHPSGPPSLAEQVAAQLAEQQDQDPAPAAAPSAAVPSPSAPGDDDALLTLLADGWDALAR